MFVPSDSVGSRGIDEDELSILLSRDGEFRFVDGGDAVSDRNPLPVDEDRALGRGEIGVTEVRRRHVAKAGPRKERCAQDSRISADQQRLGILWIPARQFDETSRAIRFGKFAAVPARRPTAVAGQQPDLEELEGILVAVVFGMTDSGSGAHDLDVASNCPTDVAGTIFVGDRALPDIGDDFHVGMGVAAKAGAGRDLVVIPDHEGAKWTIRPIALSRNDEVVVGL